MAVKTKLTVKHVDYNSSASSIKTNSENFLCDPTKINVNMSSDTAVAVYNWALGYCNLSKDTYSDAEITQSVSLNEIAQNEQRC